MLPSILVLVGQHDDDDDGNDDDAEASAEATDIFVLLHDKQRMEQTKAALFTLFVVAVPPKIGFKEKHQPAFAVVQLEESLRVHRKRAIKLPPSPFPTQYLAY